MLDYRLDRRSDVSWEVRLATVGRMLDQRGPELPTLHITVLDGGIVLQRPAEVDDALRRLGIDPAPNPGRTPRTTSGRETDPPEARAAVVEEPFIVKRVAAAAPPPHPAALSDVARDRLRRLMRSARAAPPRPGSAQPI